MRTFIAASDDALWLGAGTINGHTGANSPDSGSGSGSGTVDASGGSGGGGGSQDSVHMRRSLLLRQCRRAPSWRLTHLASERPLFSRGRPRNPSCLRLRLWAMPNLLCCEQRVPDHLPGHLTEV